MQILFFIVNCFSMHLFPAYLSRWMLEGSWQQENPMLHPVLILCVDRTNLCNQSLPLLHIVHDGTVSCWNLEVAKSRKKFATIARIEDAVYIHTHLQYIHIHTYRQYLYDAFELWERCGSTVFTELSWTIFIIMFIFNKAFFRLTKCIMNSFLLRPRWFIQWDFWNKYYFGYKITFICFVLFWFF